MLTNSCKIRNGYYDVTRISARIIEWRHHVLDMDSKPSIVKSLVFSI